MSPWLPEWYMINGGYSAPTAPTPNDLKIPWVSINTTSPTTVVLTFGGSNVTPGSYGGAIVSAGTYNDPDFVINTNTATYTRSDLNPGQKYSFRVRAYSGAGATGTYGDYIYDSFTMPKFASVASPSASTSGTTTPTTPTYTDELTKSKLAKILAEEYAAILAASGANENIDLSNSVMSKTEKLGTSTAFSGNRELQRSYLKVTSTNKDKIGRAHV